MPGMEVLSVSDLTRCIRGVIESEDLFYDVWVRGEISNLVKHSSGHVYFSMKDETALIRGVMWSNSARNLSFGLSNGMRVLARGRVSVYEKQGQYQLSVSEIMPDGVGALYTALEQLKAKLQSEGIFDPTNKRAIPAFPQKIAIITSRTAAALRDMVSIARRRMPSADLLLVPALMQGAGSESSVVDALNLAGALDSIDVIVLGRGGGSIEDLWTFNSEAVVRAIYSCPIPIVSAIGHETDFTLADMVADLRAPTPSAAMELILPDRDELLERLQSTEESLVGSIRSIISRKQAELDLILRSQAFRYPERMLQGKCQSLDMITEHLVRSFDAKVAACENRLAKASASLQTLSPLSILARGYGVVRRVSDASVIKTASSVSAGDSIEVLLSDGRLVAEIKDIKEGWV